MASPASVLGESGKSTSESSLSCSFSSSGSDESGVEEGRESEHGAIEPYMYEPVASNDADSDSDVPKLKNDGTVQTGVYFNSCIGAAL